MCNVDVFHIKPHIDRLTGKALRISQNNIHLLEGREIMKTNIRGGIFHLTKYVLFFSIILLLSCTSTSVMRLEGSDFKENLPGLWEGKWYSGSISDIVRIKIIKIDGNKVHLTGWMSGGAHNDLDEVYGRIENSTLLLTWPAGADFGCKEEYTMKRDDSNNLILDGHQKCSGYGEGKVQLKKIE
jgi:hypothetical protein